MYMNKLLDPFTAYKRVRNRIRKHFPDQLILACISQLLHSDATKVERMINWRPWDLLLIIKWTILESRNSQPVLKGVSYNDLAHLMNLMHDLNGSLRLPSEFDNIFLFLRNIANQQVWVQEDFLSARFARQRLIFGSLVQTHSFQSHFIDTVQIEIETFIELSIALISAFIFQRKSRISEDWFSSLTSIYGDEAITNYLDSLTLNISSAREWLLNQKSGESSINYQYFEQSPLKRFPLIRLNNRIYPYSRELLSQCLNSFIFDVLRDRSPSEFMDKFGQVFERYVEKCLRYSHENIHLEEEIQLDLGSSKKLVDFLIEDHQKTILVEAKGVELPFIGMVSHLAEVVRDRTGTSIVKGIDQAYATISLLQDHPGIIGSSLESQDIYLIIVTYKDLYVGSGSDFAEFIAPVKFEEIVQKYGGSKLVRPEHMYFVSIDDLEIALQCLRNSKISFPDMLNDCVDSDEHPHSKKFVFRQHLFEMFDVIELPEFLTAEYDDLFLSLKNKTGIDLGLDDPQD
jgi:hypothetical protein